MDTAAAQKAFDALTESFNRLNVIRHQVIDCYNRLAQSTADVKQFKVVMSEFEQRRKDWDVALKELTTVQREFISLAYNVIANSPMPVQISRKIH